MKSRCDCACRRKMKLPARASLDLSRTKQPSACRLEALLKFVDQSSWLLTAPLVSKPPSELSTAASAHRLFVRDDFGSTTSGADSHQLRNRLRQPDTPAL